MIWNRPYSPLISQPPVGNGICTNLRVLRAPVARPHTYGVRLCSCAAFATDTCRPTACTTHTMPSPSPNF